VNAWNPAVTDAADSVGVLLEAADDEVEVEVEVEVPAAAGRTEASATVLDAGVVELVAVVVDPDVVEALVDAVVEVALDAGVADAVDDVVNGIAGVGGASKRMNNVKLTACGFKSDAVLALLILSTVKTVSSGRGLGAHCGVGKFRLSGNRSLVTPSSTL
jgi:hypothetical protein